MKMKAAMPIAPDIDAGPVAAPAPIMADVAPAPMRNDLPKQAGGGRIGARDGLGGGKGGLALHSSISGANIAGREVAHSSKHR